MNNPNSQNDRTSTEHRTQSDHIKVNPKSLGVLERDHTTALVLSIFLGIFGIDQFYLGKTGKGLLKLFTLGLFGILWLIDVIMIATKSVNGVAWKEEAMADKTASGNWFAKHKVLTVIIALFVFGIIIAATSSSKTPTTTNNSTNASAKTSANTTPSKSSTQTTSKPATRQVKGTATTLGAGTFTGGKDVAVGLYDVTPGAGQSGNFTVSGTDSYNEILGGGDVSLGDVPMIRVQISSGDQIQISSLSSVTFTPVTAAFVTTHAAASLYAGTFIVGQDIGAGRYVVTPGSGQSGNFTVSGNDSYNEILGSDSSMGDVPSLTVTLTDGDVIAISSLSQVNFAPSN